MGMFLSLSGVIGRTQDEVRDSLARYAASVDGGLQEAELTTDDKNCCVIQESNHNTTVLYPFDYIEWDRSSEFLSKELNAPVFSFHIHDGDLWMYVLYLNGQVLDQFNPIPDYWDDGVSESEIQSWKGSASVVAKHIGLPPAEIEHYLIRWDLNAEESQKAYDDDEFANEDWQLLDFLRKCRLPYPLDDDRNAKGRIYKIWTKELTLSPEINTRSGQVKTISQEKPINQAKPWWKFWG
ncbi:hypothetical protein WBG78_23095 [Chryseolinea sp. T2]|uniref:hypothetical protein n=1 Tax=Chryseolinea sp. T2 TaxID=3129255 RepID=UPI003077F6B5